MKLVTLVVVVSRNAGFTYVVFPCSISFSNGGCCSLNSIERIFENIAD